MQDVVIRVLNFLGINSRSSELIAGVSRGRIGHVILLVYPRLMAKGINIAVKAGRWDTYFSRSQLDISVSTEESQEPEDEGHIVTLREELSASNPDALSGHQLAMVDCNWHPRWMPGTFT